MLNVLLDRFPWIDRIVGCLMANTQVYPLKIQGVAVHFLAVRRSWVPPPPDTAHTQGTPWLSHSTIKGMSTCPYMIQVRYLPEQLLTVPQVLRIPMKEHHYFVMIALRGLTAVTLLRFVFLLTFDLAREVAIHVQVVLPLISDVQAGHMRDLGFPQLLL